MNNKKETLEKIKEAFECHKGEKALLVTTDGNIFLESAKNFAIDHANKTGGKVTTVKRDEFNTGESFSQDEKSPLDNMTIKEIKSYALENRIELTSTKKADLILELRTKLQSIKEEE